MAPVANRNNLKIPGESKLPRRSIASASLIHKKQINVPTTNRVSIAPTSLLKVAAASVLSNAKSGNDLLKPAQAIRPGFERRPSIAPQRVTHQAAKSTLANENIGSGDRRSVIGLNKDRLLNLTGKSFVDRDAGNSDRQSFMAKDVRRSGIPPPRKSVFGSTFNRPPPRASLVVPKILIDDQNDTGPIQFQADQTALRSILTNKGVAENNSRPASFVAQGGVKRKSIYGRRNNMPGSFEEVTERLARGLLAHSQQGRLSIVLDGDMKPKTPGRLSMYRRQSTARLFGTSTPLSARKVDHKNEAGTSGVGKNSFLAPMAPLNDSDESLLTPFSQKRKTPLRNVVNTCKNSQTMNGNLSQQLQFPNPILPRVVITQPSPSKAHRKQEKEALTSAVSAKPLNAARRTTREFQELYAQYSLDRLENELEMVENTLATAIKQKKAIEKLLKEHEAKPASVKKVVISVAVALETIAEGKERESTSPPARMEMEKIEEETDNEYGEIAPAKIRTRRNAVMEKENMDSNFGMKLRPRNGKINWKN